MSTSAFPHECRILGFDAGPHRIVDRNGGTPSKTDNSKSLSGAVGTLEIDTPFSGITSQNKDIQDFQAGKQFNWIDGLIELTDNRSIQIVRQFNQPTLVNQSINSKSRLIDEIDGLTDRRSGRGLAGTLKRVIQDPVLQFLTLPSCPDHSVMDVPDLDTKNHREEGSDSVKDDFNEESDGDTSAVSPPEDGDGDGDGEIEVEVVTLYD
ncbi:hypothetical protein V1523DRAFT_399506 [Lipomyces doorenjongii]